MNERLGRLLLAVYVLLGCSTPRSTPTLHDCYGAGIICESAVRATGKVPATMRFGPKECAGPDKDECYVVTGSAGTKTFACWVCHEGGGRLRLNAPVVVLP